jgi:enoyl-CoA hydratase/carnithine racemase
MLTSKPLIAAIDGYAVAGGLELSLLCDLRVVEENAIFGVFCRRFGVPLIDGGTVRLSKLIGLSRALDLILTGRPINAKEALDFGLANRVVAVGTALGQAFNLALSIAKFPQECLKADRKSTYYATFDAKSLQEALIFEYENGKPIISRESVQGLLQFCSFTLLLFI